jgi:hypothetical protein
MIRRLVAALLVLPGGAAAQELAVTPLVNGTEWLRGDGALELVISRAVTESDGRLVVMVGTTDLSTLFTTFGDRMQFQRRGIRLPEGKSELAVFLVTPAGEWRELSRAPIQVLTRAGFQETAFTPKLALNNKGQLAEGHGAAPEPERSEYQDFTLNTGFQTRHHRNGWAVETQANLVGVSNRAEALRFGERQQQAPRLDLSDYLVTVTRGAGAISVGHVSFGASRHLINGFGSRGVSGRLGVARGLELSLAAMNGSSVVGWSNPLGVGRPHHRLVSGTVGLEAAPGRPGLLRVEATVLEGKVLPQAGYTQGVVNDAEESRGLGLRLQASDPTQRVRLEAGFSRSRFVNPRDSALEQGGILVPVRPETKNARYIDLNVELVRGLNLGASLPVGLSANLRHERIDPLFRSIAASSQADFQDNALGLTASLGQLNLQGTLARSRDNLAGLETILTTRTRTGGLNVALPSGFVLGSASVLLPVLTYSLNRVHQFGEGVPASSDFSATHVPDQMSTNHALAAQWQGRIWRLGYQLGRTTQDNRQTGRENADFGNLTHGVGIGLTPAAALELGLELGFERARNEEADQVGRTRRVGASGTWRFTGRSALAAAWSTTRNYDDPRTQEQKSSELRVELSQRVELLRLSSGRMNGQLFVRYARQTAETNAPGAVAVPFKAWSVNSGVSLTVF